MRRGGFREDTRPADSRAALPWCCALRARRVGIAARTSSSPSINPQPALSAVVWTQGKTCVSSVRVMLVLDPLPRLHACQVGRCGGW